MWIWRYNAGVDDLPLQEGWLTLKQAADKTGYTKSMLARLCRLGDVEAYRVGFLWLVSEASLDEYIERGKQSGDRRYGPK